jgi:hypothetical protein
MKDKLNINNLIIWDFGFMVVTNIYKTVNTINY